MKTVVMVLILLNKKDSHDDNSVALITYSQSVKIIFTSLSCAVYRQKLHLPVVHDNVVGSTEREQGRERKKEMFSHFRISLTAIKLQTVY